MRERTLQLLPRKRFSRYTTIVVQSVFKGLPAGAASARICLTQVRQVRNKSVMSNLPVADTEVVQVEIAVYMGVISPGYDRSSPENGIIRKFRRVLGLQNMWIDQLRMPYLSFGIL